LTRPVTIAPVALQAVMVPAVILAVVAVVEFVAGTFVGAAD
jgi:hypothetical protein